MHYICNRDGVLMNEDLRAEIGSLDDDGFSCFCCHDGLDFVIGASGEYEDCYAWDDFLKGRRFHG